MSRFIPDTLKKFNFHFTLKIRTSGKVILTRNFIKTMFLTYTKNFRISNLKLPRSLDTDVIC